MILQVNKNPTRRELRQFGVVILLGFGALGILVHVKGHPVAASASGAVAIGIGLWSLLWPHRSKSIYRVWMGFGALVGNVVSRLVMTFLFYCIITPVGLWFRWIGRDGLQLKKDPRATSYWRDHPPIINKKEYERLF